MAATTLYDLAKTIRSKNASVDKVTFDVIFRSRDDYDRVRRTGVLSREAICRIYGVKLVDFLTSIEIE